MGKNRPLKVSEAVEKIISSAEADEDDWHTTQSGAFLCCPIGEIMENVAHMHARIIRELKRKRPDWKLSPDIPPDLEVSAELRSDPTRIFILKNA